jgi:hypothetical protein
VTTWAISGTAVGDGDGEGEAAAIAATSVAIIESFPLREADYARALETVS